MGNLDQARHDLNQLRSIVRELAKSDKEVSGGVERELQIVIPWIDHLEGKDVEALRLLRSLADKEQGVSEANQGIPPREMLGDMLLELKRPEEAFAEYVAELKMNPNRFDSLYGAGRAAELAGKIDQAMLYYGRLLTICQGSNSERPELIPAKRIAKDSLRLRSQ
jgi:tetratricopeptide (TPR) repeat protein